jgi:hypothetical protein
VEILKGLNLSCLIKAFLFQIGLLLEHRHRCRYFSSKLNFRFGIDKKFSNGPFLMSKLWIWTKILSEVAHFGQISCPNCTSGELLDQLVSRKMNPFAPISDSTLGDVAQNVDVPAGCTIETS